MLTPRSDRPQAVRARLTRRLNRYRDHPWLPTAMGCTVCPQYGQCGGLHTLRKQFDCLSLCCGNPAGCTKVCRRNVARYTEQVREIDGFELGTTPRTPEVSCAPLPPFVPILYHKGRRERRVNRGAVALPLYALFDKRTGAPKYCSRLALCDAYGLAPNVQIILTGTDQDPPLERWWRHGTARRAQAIANLRVLGVALVTTPNYSLYPHVPRWDDLHSMKCIALVQAELAGAGVPAALHVNGRTEQDFKRWGQYLAQRPEVTHIAYEFGTGAGHPDRMPQHIEWLTDLARTAGRRITLVVRGGITALPALAQTFDMVFLDTDVFMRSMNRQSAVRVGNARLRWEAAPTARGEALDDLFERNAEQREAFVRMVLGQHDAPVAA